MAVIHSVIVCRRSWNTIRTYLRINYMHYMRTYGLGPMARMRLKSELRFFRQTSFPALLQQPATKLFTSQQTIHQHPAPSILSSLTTYDESPSHLAPGVVSHSEEPRITIPLSPTNNTPLQPLTHSPTTTITSQSPSPSIKNTISQLSPHLSPMMEQLSINQATESMPLLRPAIIADERDRGGVPFCVICRFFCS